MDQENTNPFYPDLMQIFNLGENLRLHTMRLLVTFFLLLSFGGVHCQQSFVTERAATASLPEHFEFLRLPCDANIPEQLEPNIQWLEEKFSARGFAVRRIPTEGIDVLLAEWKAEGDVPTVLFYVQVDGQPVDSSRPLVNPDNNQHSPNENCLLYNCYWGSRCAAAY